MQSDIEAQIEQLKHDFPKLYKYLAKLSENL